MSNYFQEEYNGPPPANRTFNGGDWFSFIAKTGETEAGALIIRNNLVGFSDGATAIGKSGNAHRFGSMSVKKAAAATAFEQGELVFYKDGAIRATASGAVFIGYCHFDSAAGNPEVEVILATGLPPALAPANATPGGSG